MRGFIWLDTPRGEVTTAILIAVVSFFTALVVYLTNTAGSNATNLNHQGLIDKVKLEAYANENWRMVYQEAATAYSYQVEKANIASLAASKDPISRAQAKSTEQMLLPNLKLNADEFLSSPKYVRADGSFDLQARFNDLQSLPEIQQLDPEKTFKKADEFYKEQRWYLIGSVILATSLFWLGLAQITHKHRRVISVLIGFFMFGIGFIWSMGYLLGL